MSYTFWVKIERKGVSIIFFEKRLRDHIAYSLAPSIDRIRKKAPARNQKGVLLWKIIRTDKTETEPYRVLFFFFYLASTFSRKEEKEEKKYCSIAQTYICRSKRNFGLFFFFSNFHSFSAFCQSIIKLNLVRRTRKFC